MNRVAGWTGGHLAEDHRALIGCNGCTMWVEGMHGAPGAAFLEKLAQIHSLVSSHTSQFIVH